MPMRKLLPFVRTKAIEDQINEFLDKVSEAGMVSIVFDTWPEISMPISAHALIANGLTVAGAEPAECTAPGEKGRQSRCRTSGSWKMRSSMKLRYPSRKR